MNYQGNTTRRDFVAFLLVFWFLAQYYPYLSGGLIVCMMVSTFWERSLNGADVIVRYFTGNVKHSGAVNSTSSANSTAGGKASNTPAGHLEQNIKMASHSIIIDDSYDQKEN